MNNILYDTQKQIVDLIKEDAELSSVTILAENSKDIDYEISEALGQQGIVAVVMTPKANYIGNYEDKMIAWEIDELTIQVVENTVVNRGKKDGVLTGQDVAMRIMDWLSSPKYGRQGTFSPIGYEQGEDNSLLVNKTVFKCAVYENEQEEPIEPEEPEEPDDFEYIPEDFSTWPETQIAQYTYEFTDDMPLSVRNQTVTFGQYKNQSYETGTLCVDWGDGSPMTSYRNTDGSGTYRTILSAAHTYQPDVKHVVLKAYYIPYSANSSSYWQFRHSDCNFQKFYSETDETYRSIITRACLRQEPRQKNFSANTPSISYSSSQLFKGCKNLKSVDIQMARNIYNAGSFSYFVKDCENLRVVNIQQGYFANFNAYNFANCPKLRKIYCNDLSSSSGYYNLGREGLAESHKLDYIAPFDETLSARFTRFQTSAFVDFPKKFKIDNIKFYTGSSSTIESTAFDGVDLSTLNNINELNFYPTLTSSSLTIQNGALSAFTDLSSINGNGIPTVVLTGNEAYANRPNLKYIDGFDKLNLRTTVSANNLFAFDTQLERVPTIRFEQTATTGMLLFQGCSSLKEVTLDFKNRISLAQGIFTACPSLKKVKITGAGCNFTRTLTHGLFPFSGCFNLEIIDFSEITNTTIPTIYSTMVAVTNFNNMFGIDSKLRFVVPDAMYDDWIVATNWVTIADRIIKASDYQNELTEKENEVTE